MIIDQNKRRLTPPEGDHIMTKDIAIDDEMPFLLAEKRGLRIGVDLSCCGITSAAAI